MSFETLNSLKREKGRDREFIAINELLSYGKAPDYIHIHVVPEEKVENFMTSFRDGMQKLAKIVNDDENVKEIIAVSWIVAAHPKILERMGFTIDGEVDKKMRREHFPGEKRPIWKAHISRDDFLEKYLEKVN